MEGLAPDGIHILSHVVCLTGSPGDCLSGVNKGSQSTGPARPPGLDPGGKGHPGLRLWLCSPARPAFFPDLAPGIDEIYEESQQVFLAPGHPQDGQVVFYKVSRHCPASSLRPWLCPTNAHLPWQISVDRGLKWEEAFAKALELTGPYDGFYLSYKVGSHLRPTPACSLYSGARPG